MAVNSSSSECSRLITQDQECQKIQILVNAKPKPSFLKSRVVLCLVAVPFIACVGYAMILPFLWPFLKFLGGSKFEYSLAFGFFSGGNFVSVLILGVASDRFAPVPLIQSALLCGFIGSVMYGLAWSEFLIYPARFLWGASIGVFPVILRTINTLAPTDWECSVATSLTAQSSTIAYIIGPGLALICTILPDWHSFNGIEFQWVSPGYLSAFLFALASFLVWSCRDQWPGAPVKKVTTKSSSKAVTTREGFASNSSNRLLPETSFQNTINDNSQIIEQEPMVGLIVAQMIVGCLLYSILSVCEGVGPAFTQNLYGWSERDNSLFWFVNALIGFVACIFLMGGFLERAVVPPPCIVVEMVTYEGGKGRYFDDSCTTTPAGSLKRGNDAALKPEQQQQQQQQQQIQQQSSPASLQNDAFLRAVTSVSTVLSAIPITGITCRLCPPKPVKKDKSSSSNDTTPLISDNSGNAFPRVEVKITMLEGQLDIAAPLLANTTGVLAVRKEIKAAVFHSVMLTLSTLYMMIVSAVFLVNSFDMQRVLPSIFYVIGNGLSSLIFTSAIVANMCGQQRSLPKSVGGLVLAIQAASTCLMRFLGPIWGVQVWDHMGPGWLFLSTVILFFVAFVLSIYVQVMHIRFSVTHIPLGRDANLPSMASASCDLFP